LSKIGLSITVRRPIELISLGFIFPGPEKNSLLACCCKFLRMSRVEDNVFNIILDFFMDGMANDS